MPNTLHYQQFLETSSIYEVINIVLWTYFAACIIVLCVTDIDSAFTTRILGRVVYIAGFLILTLLAEVGELVWRRQIEREVNINQPWQN